MTQALDINDITFQTEDLGGVDVAAAEAATAYAPSIAPGKYHTFTFALEEASNDPQKPRPYKLSQQQDGTKLLTVFFRGTLVTPDGPGKTVRFQNVNNRKRGTSKVSDLDLLLYALLGKDAPATYNLTTLDEALKGAEGDQRTFQGLVQWRAYDKDSELTLSTSPQKGYTKRDGTKVADELPWPKTADGHFVKRPEFPNGNPAQGREEIVRTAPVRTTTTGGTA